MRDDKTMVRKTAAAQLISLHRSVMCKRKIEI